MLYVSTRDHLDAFTTGRVLDADYAPDGGLFVPFRLPVFSFEEVEGILSLSFGDAVSKIFNLFFTGHLTGWDVEFAIGRVPVKLFQMNHRLIVAELWHNPGGMFDYIVEKLYACVHSDACRNKPTEWVKLAVRISVLFGVFTLVQKDGYVAAHGTVDLALPADDFSVPMAAWYARKMGLPIGMVICGCNMNSGFWDLLRKGEYNTAAAPAVTRIGHERLVRECLGVEACKKYVFQCDAGRVYTLTDDARETLGEGLYAAVVGKARIESLENAVRKSTGYYLSEGAALAYGALQDYRAGSGEGRISLIFTDVKAKPLTNI